MVYVYRGRRRGPLLVGAALMIAALFTKQEVGAAIAVTWLVAAWAHRPGWRDVLVVAIATVAAAAMFTALFGAAGWRDMTKLIGAASGGGFFGHVSGMNQWRSALGVTAAGTAFVAGVMLLAARARRNAWWTGAAAIGIAMALWYAESFAFRAAMPLAIGAVVWCVMTGRRRDPLLLVAVLVLACCPRVLLRFDPRWYGFYLYVPAYLLMAYGLGVWLAPRTGRPRTVMIALAAVALVTAGRFNMDTLAASEAKTEAIVTPRGVVRDYPIGRAEAITACLGYLREHAWPRDTLVVLPEGATLNWWSGLPNPTRFYNFIPPELTDAGVRRRIVSELERTRPTYVAVVVRQLPEFGVANLEAYMPRVMELIDREYKVVSVFGEPGPHWWRMALLERREDEAGR